MGGVRGSWAEFTTSAGKSYYVNTVTGEQTWIRPAGYDRAAASTSALSGQSLGGQHSNVFVGNLPVNMNEVVFRQMFTGFGNIVSIKVEHGKNYGFVKYASVLEAQRAIEAMNGYHLSGIE